MIIKNDDLYNLLTEYSYVDQKKLKEIYQLSNKQKTSLYDSLLEQNLLLDTQLAQIVADYLSIPYINLSNVAISQEVLQLIPESTARHQNVIAFKKDQSLHVAMADPTNREIIEFIKRKSGLLITVYIATAADIANAFALYSKDMVKAFEEVIKQHQEKKTSEEPSIVKLVDMILSYAYESKASDIHIEPEEKNALVRFRIDGVLHDIVKVPLDMFPQVVTKIKVLTNLRTDEHLAPQDGKMQYKTDKEQLDIRVSIVPISQGEKVVLRLLSENSRQITLSLLGLSQEDLKKVEEAYKKPYGMVLATGPTGSGKTTTMYAIIRLINNRDVNIMTIEDPIEYQIEGVNQIQVHDKTDLTFANGLRSILRQDPNVILVGEIRDEETAGIAVNAAMTGHLVLSTLHTNDAPSALPRLFDLKVEPFLVASTVNVIIAQRLVRKIHTVCRVSEEIELSDIAKQLDKTLVKKAFGVAKKVLLYKGKGCQICHNTGYEGRVGIFEILVVDDLLREEIVAKKDANTIRKSAIKQGMTTMIEDGLEKVKQGITTIDEILRVTKE